MDLKKDKDFIKEWNLLFTAEIGIMFQERNVEFETIIQVDVIKGKNYLQILILF